jgi:hypothetical protein
LSIWDKYVIILRVSGQWILLGIKQLNSITLACLLNSCHSGRAQVVDAAVLKFKGAVTHFSPGSYGSRPLQRTSFPNLFMAGAPPSCFFLPCIAYRLHTVSSPTPADLVLSCAVHNAWTVLCGFAAVCYHITIITTDHFSDGAPPACR